MIEWWRGGWVRPPTHTCKSPGCSLIYFIPFGSKGIVEDNDKWVALCQKAGEDDNVDISLRGRKSHGRADGFRSQSKTNH